MRKLSLKLDDLCLQSFDTLSSTSTGLGTVVGHLDDASHDELACSSACATQVYTCAGCETYDACSDDGGPDEQRRIIVYQTTS
jgi:hypothetical protein